MCSYGQKSGNLLQLLKLHDKQTFIQLLNNNIKEEDRIKTDTIARDVKFRFYNFAGNPMMVKLAEGIIDVVFDLKGQKPHDVVGIYRDDGRRCVMGYKVRRIRFCFELSNKPSPSWGPIDEVCAGS
jgi:hypothetical protein